jgi:hypothetical protein
MTQKKLKMVSAKLFSACLVRRGSWYLENGCLGHLSRRPLTRHGRACKPRGEVPQQSAHAARS